MYVYTPVRNNAGRATTLAHYPFSGQPPSLPPPPPVALYSSTKLPPSLPCATPTLTATYTLYHRPPTSSFPPSSPITHSSPSQLCEHGVTASTIRNAHHHPLLSPITCTILLSPYVPFSFPFCFHFRLPQTPDPIHPRRVRPYGAVSTGTPARSLKENAIIRRTSTNELIVGASRYRQYREVLYSTSPGATRL